MNALNVLSAKKLFVISALAIGSLGLTACNNADDVETVETTTPDAAVVTNDTGTVVADEPMATDAGDDVAVATAE